MNVAEQNINARIPHQDLSAPGNEAHIQSNTLPAGHLTSRGRPPRPQAKRALTTFSPTASRGPQMLSTSRLGGGGLRHFCVHARRTHPHPHTLTHTHARRAVADATARHVTTAGQITSVAADATAPSRHNRVHLTVPRFPHSMGYHRPSTNLQSSLALRGSVPFSSCTQLTTPCSGVVAFAILSAMLPCSTPSRSCHAATRLLTTRTILNEEMNAIRSAAQHNCAFIYESWGSVFLPIALMVVAWQLRLGMEHGAEPLGVHPSVSFGMPRVLQWAGVWSSDEGPPRPYWQHTTDDKGRAVQSARRCGD